MEEAHRRHTDVPFGWLQALQGMIRVMGAHRADAAHAPWREPEEPKRDVLDNLHHRAADIRC
jgi:hypothetical protein